MRNLQGFTPDRATGLVRLKSFVPHAGTAYARSRNFDLGAENRSNVSTLSPWLRHRLISEEEVLSDVLAAHSLTAAEKFVQEVCWRTYWKGWLEMRPQVWSDYQQEVLAAGASLSAAELDRYQAAISGKTGIECFDQWWLELRATGYLHNHARMWFASIWIFTLGLPWSLGADVFMRHLLDGDAASNTLSWRWVAGLQTVGKTYLARPDNIATFTAGRFPKTDGLVHQALPVTESRVYQRQSLRVPVEPTLTSGTALLLTDDDLGVTDTGYDLAGIERTLSLDTSGLRSPNGVANGVMQFVSNAFTDAEQRAASTVTRMRLDRTGENSAEDIISWCKDHDIEQLVSAFVPVGPSRDVLDSLHDRFTAEGIRWAQIQRPWDRLLWPYANKGFFNFKKFIPHVLEQRGLIGGQAKSA